jgi:hypothetical protein
LSTSSSSAATAPDETDSPYPDSIVVLGHSGATGANSDNRGVDVKANSWATGTNPEVESIYLRVLALNPAVEGNNTNLAVLDMITTGAPDATVFFVSSPPGTNQNYADVIKEVPAAWRSLAGDEPCDMFDESGAPRTTW